MAKPKKRSSADAPHYPEKKFGPFSGGVSISIWLQEVQTSEGSRYFRSATIQGRRFRDKTTGEWKDGALRPTDLPALILGLEATQRYMATTPLPGAAAEDEADVPENGQVAEEPTPF